MGLRDETGTHRRGCAQCVILSMESPGLQAGEDVKRKGHRARFFQKLVPACVPPVSLFRDECIHRDNRRLRRENLFGENTVDFLVGIETGVLEHDATKIQVGGAPERGKRNAAGGNSEEHQIFDAARPQNQVQLVLRKCADSLLIDHEIFRAGDGAVGDSADGVPITKRLLSFTSLKRDSVSGISGWPAENPSPTWII